MLTKINYINLFIKVSSSALKRIPRLLCFNWIISCTLLMTLFSNDILSKLISPSYKPINSIGQLNQYKSSKTSLIWNESFVAKKHLVKLM